MRKKCFYFVFIFFTYSYVTKVECCHSFENIALSVVPRQGDLFNLTSFSGCFERRSFENHTATEIYVSRQNVSNIDEDNIKHLVKLKKLVFLECPLKSISPGAFRNLPVLQNVEITYGNLTRIQENVFAELSNLQVLRLSDNDINVIEDQALWNLSKLKRLYLRNNNLTIWNISWFKNTSNIEFMDFQKNKIKKIPSEALHGMSKLKQLFYDYNEIEIIEPNAFKGIKHLNYLGLRYNRLKEINENIFPEGLSVRSLLIEANYLNFLSNEVMRKLSVQELGLEGNPWKCPCLDRIHFWLYSSNSTLKKSEDCSGSDIPSCSYTLSYSKTCLEITDELVTVSYLENLRQIRPKLKRYCARLN